jgi:hypothetical protein
LSSGQASFHVERERAIDGGFNGQRKFFLLLADYLAAMRGSRETTILTFFGDRGRLGNRECHAQPVRFQVDLTAGS